MASRSLLALQLAVGLLLGACGFVIGAETPESGVCSSASCEAAGQGDEASFEQGAGEQDDSMSLLALRKATDVEKRLLAPNPCQSCSTCIRAENPTQRFITDRLCQNCAMGKRGYWPCNVAPPQCRCSDSPSPGPSPAGRRRRRVRPYGRRRRSPSPTPAPGPGVVAGFWYGYAGSATDAPAPTSGTFISFPGLIVEPPFTAGSGRIPKIPNGNYLHKVLTQGGGGTKWDDTLYAKMESELGQYKAGGWDGVMWDWEVVGPGHTTSGFNNLMAATKAAGLLNYVTTDAEGPYSWTADDKDATGIDWSQVDFLVLQMYGASGDDFPDSQLQRYYNYWANGGGTSIHNTIFKAPPTSKLMWGLKVGTCGRASGFQPPSCVEWAYSPNR